MHFSITSTTLAILSLAKLSHACIKAHGLYAMRTYKAWDWEIYDNRILQCTLADFKLTNAPANGDGREIQMECIPMYRLGFGMMIMERLLLGITGIIKMTSQNEVRMWTADGTASLEERFEEMELYGYAHCTEEGDRPDLWIEDE